jgi:hypothetical protein
MSDLSAWPLLPSWFVITPPAWVTRERTVDVLDLVSFALVTPEFLGEKRIEEFRSFQAKYMPRQKLDLITQILSILGLPFVLIWILINIGVIYLRAWVDHAIVLYSVVLAWWTYFSLLVRWSGTKFLFWLGAICFVVARVVAF